MVFRKSDAKLVDAKDSVLIVGSMLSSDYTTNLPNGMTLSKEIVARLSELAFLYSGSEGVERPPEYIIKEITGRAESTPFEVLLEYYPNPGKLNKILSSFSSKGVPNRFHKRIIDTIDRGGIRHVVTVNYDTCIEDAAGEKYFSKIVITEEDYWSLTEEDFNRSILFKIHGCAKHEDTLVYRLSQEGTLPEWKLDLLRKLFFGRDVFLIGYSGLDFDICPVLFYIERKNMYWLFKEESFDKNIEQASPNVKHVHSQQGFDNLFAIFGGFDNFFSGDVALEKFRPTFECHGVVDELFNDKSIHRDEYLYWASSLFDVISCRRASQAALSQIKSSDIISADRIFNRQSSIDERSGKYLTSIANLRKMRDLVCLKEEKTEYLETYFHEAARFYTNGDIFRLFKHVKLFERKAQELKESGYTYDENKEKAWTTYLHALRIKACRQFGFFGRRFERYAKIRCDEGLMSEAADIHYEQGNWQFVRLLQKAAQDIGLKISIGSGKDDTRHLLISSVQGFAHLNNFVGRASASRDDPHTKPSACTDILRGLYAYEHSAELPKCFQAFAPKLDKEHFDFYKRVAWNELRRCEYHILARAKYSWGYVKTVARARPSQKSSQHDGGIVAGASAPPPNSPPPAPPPPAAR